jgi:hypothetical protein
VSVSLVLYFDDHMYAVRHTQTCMVLLQHCSYDMALVTLTIVIAVNIDDDALLIIFESST